MTLDTRIYVLDQVDARELFAYCRQLLGATDQHKTYDHPGRIGNELGQGLPALLGIDYGLEAPLRTPEQAAEHDEDLCNLPGVDWYSEEEGPCDGVHRWRRACWAEISFDTAYGYRDDRGYGCGDLHAEYVAKVGQWLDAKGIRWEWQNEFTGEIHTGYDRLTNLGRRGADAADWFRTTVLPAIEADLAAKTEAQS